MNKDIYETDMYKMRAEFTNAVWTLEVLEVAAYYIRIYSNCIIYANIPHFILLGSVIVGIFLYKILTIRGKISSFSYTV